MNQSVISMKKIFAFLIFTMTLVTVSIAQQKQISVEEIYRGAFRTQGLDVLRSMKNGKQYTILNRGWNDLAELKNFSSYQFSADESKILLATAVEPIFRRSTLGIYYVYDIATKKLTKISESKIQEPTLSPNGKQVAYAANNNLYIFNMEVKSSEKLTTDGVKNKIINGITDWVYEEEFAFVRAFDWNSDGTKIAFLRFDETNVPEFSMDVYGSELYQKPYVFKYPKAGEENAKVSLHMYDVASKKISNIDLGNPYYIPRIKWMNSPNRLSVQTINRHQSEEDGNNHIYLYSAEGPLMNQITNGNWEITKYYGYDQNEDRIYYQSTENGSINRGVYSIDSSGKNKKRLAVADGVNNADFSTNFSYFINTHSSAKSPYKYTLHNALSGKKIKDIKDNTALSAKLAAYDIQPKEFSTIAINGNDLNMYMIKPANFDASKKYPLLMYQYSGPGSQNVANRWNGGNDYWHQMLVSEGYIVACVDGRGTGFKGRDFKKVTQMNLVKYETEDQIAAARKLSELPYIDEKRTGIWGWSFGGHMATNCILKGNDVFETAIAVAPVTSWRFYDTIYTERYMRTPQENPSGYDDNSPFNYPELLKGNYLLVHGSGDDNVHVQNSMRMIEALIQADKQFEWAIYPDKAHSIRGGNTRIHLYNKMTNFIKSNL